MVIAQLVQGLDVATMVNGFFAMLALVAGGLSALQFGTLGSLRADNKDLRERGQDRDGKITELTAEMTVLKNDRDALARQLRGDDKIDALMVKLDSHHKEAMTHWKTGESLMKGLVDELTGGHE